MQKYSDVILDRKGNVVPSATVLVKALGSATPATIYAANSTSQLQANPSPVSLSLTGTPKLSRVDGGDFDGCTNYGILGNFGAISA